MLTFRTMTRKDSKVTALNVARQVTVRQLAGPNRVMVIRSILQETETRKKTYLLPSGRSY